MTLVLPAPDPRAGDRLAASIEKASGLPASVLLADGEWHIDTDASEAAVRPVVDAHDGSPAPASVEQSARQRLGELKAKGWANLTASEKTEVAQRLLEAIA